MRLKVFEYEERVSKLTGYLGNSVRLNFQTLSVMKHLWFLITEVYPNFSDPEIGTESIREPFIREWKS